MITKTALGTVFSKAVNVFLCFILRVGNSDAESVEEPAVVVRVVLKNVNGQNDNDKHDSCNSSQQGKLLFDILTLVFAKICFRASATDRAGQALRFTALNKNGNYKEDRGSNQNCAENYINNHVFPPFKDKIVISENYSNTIVFKNQ